jgi:hypothetical protein
MLITDQANERVIEVTFLTKQIAWQYGTTGVSGNGPNQLNNPNCALLLENGHVLICDENNNRAIEVTHTNPSQIVWQYGSGNPNINQPVSGVAFASRLENGNTLITDSNHSRIVEIDPNKNVVWTAAWLAIRYRGDRYGSGLIPRCNPLRLPPSAAPHARLPWRLPAPPITTTLAWPPTHTV